MDERQIIQLVREALGNPNLNVGVMVGSNLIVLTAVGGFVSEEQVIIADTLEAYCRRIVTRQPLVRFL